MNASGRYLLDIFFLQALLHFSYAIHLNITRSNWWFEWRLLSWSVSVNCHSRLFKELGAEDCFYVLDLFLNGGLIISYVRGDLIGRFVSDSYSLKKCLIDEKQCLMIVFA